MNKMLIVFGATLWLSGDYGDKRHMCELARGEIVLLLDDSVTDEGFVKVLTTHGAGWVALCLTKAFE